MTMEKSYYIIACNAFYGALTCLNIEQRFPQVSIRYLPASLHLKPRELKQRFLFEIQRLPATALRPCCLYGHCFPDIDDVMEEKAMRRIPCAHCYETLLGPQHFQKIMTDQPGSFFIEKELLMNFDTYCWKPLEFDDPQLREWYFQHYRQIVYIRQPMDPNLTQQAEHIASRLNLALRIVDANYKELNKNLNDLLHTTKSV